MASSELALFGGPPAWPGREEHQPVDDVQVDAVRRVLDRDPTSARTEEEQFEAAFARAVGVEHAVAVNSGTSALHAALLAAGIKPADEVITPAYGFVASASVIVQQGATPVFCDVRKPDLNIDPEACARLVTPRTRAVIAVHIFGIPADNRTLRQLCDAHGLLYIEDCASAPMARIDGQRVGTNADFGCFSLNIHKIIRTGEGGVVTTRDRDRAIRLRALRDYGRGAGENWEYGLNYRMPELSAALGRAQLEHLQVALERRAINRELLFECCKDLDLEPIRAPAGVEPVGYWTSFLLPVEQAPLRHALVSALRAEGVFAHAGYGAPLHHIEYLRPYAVGRRLDVVERLAPRVLSIDPSPWFSTEDIRAMAGAIRKVCERRDELVTATS